jgi:hypothetical protein
MGAGPVLSPSSRSGAYVGHVSGALVTFAIVWTQASLTAGLSSARLVDAALSLLFVFWLSRFAGRLQKRREAERRCKVVAFPSSRAE